MKSAPAKSRSHWSLRPLALAAAFCTALPAAAAELYRWVDANGVVNYSNTPPSAPRDRKAAQVVEDKLSVYTPEKAVTDEIERSRQRPRQRPAEASFTRPPAPPTAVPPPPPVAAYDPCADPRDVSCPTYLYDGSRVFHGRRRPVPLVQPQLPPGTIAGQSAGAGAFIPGQSANAAAPRDLRSTHPRSGGFTVRDQENDRPHRRR